MPGKPRLPQSKIIEQFIAAHGDRYDYSHVNYQTVHHKVTIICREHGPFEQNPKNHRNGAVCPGCVRSRIKATNVAKYGVDNAAKTPEARKASSVKMANQVARGELKKGMLEKYGAANPKEVPELRDRMEQTFLRKYGVLNPFQINVSARVAKTKAEMIRTGQWVHPDRKPAFEKYKRDVWNLTTKNVQGIPWLQGRSRRVHLDHIYSMLDGFKNGVSPSVVASLGNLRLMEGRANIQKQTSSWMSLEDLLLVIQAVGSNDWLRA